MNLKRLFDFSPQAQLFCKIALFMFLFGLLAAAGNGFGMGNMFEGFLFALGFFVLPFTALVLGVAAFSEPYHLPRVTLWAGATGVLAGGSLVVSGLVPSAYWFVCCFPLMLPPLGVGLFFIVKAWPEAQQETATAREARALELIHSRSVITLADLAGELRLSTDEAEALVQSLVENQTLDGGLFDVPHGAVYGPKALLAKLEQLADLAKSQPETSLADMAKRVEAPPELIRDWLRRLARDHKIAGYVNEEDGAFHRLTREQWEGTSVCPKCGATWPSPNPDMPGMTKCPQCRSEVYI